MRKNLTLLSLYLALFLLDLSCADGKVIVFGDSLSDNGNAYALSGGLVPPSPYGNTYDGSMDIFPGRFTDGRNWVDYLPKVAGSFGVNGPRVTAFFASNQLNDNADDATNFAVGGSTSGNGNVLNPNPPFFLGSFPDQISAYLTSLSGKSAADDLCVIWIGANDFRAGIAPTLTVTNIKNQIANLLEKAGTRTFVVIKIPDLSLTPQVQNAGSIAIQGAQQFANTINVLLEVELLPFAWSHGINIELVDINAIFRPLVYQPGLFGFKNSAGAAFNLNAPVVPFTNPVSDPNDYIFWDGFHPTTKVHHIAAEFIYLSVFLRRHFHEFLSLR